MSPRTLPALLPAVEPEFGTSDAIAELGSHPTAAQLAAFWAGPGARSPLIEAHRPGHSRVTFLWRGEAPSVYVTLNRVTYTLDHAALQRIPGTDVWHRTVVMPNTWRCSYTMLAPTAKQSARLRAATPRWAMRMIREVGQCDPRNPLRLRTHAGEMSEVALPEAAQSPLLADTLTPVSVTTTELRTPGSRRAWLLTAAHHRGAASPLVMMLDGEVWLANGAVERVVGALGALGTTTPAAPAAPAVLLVEAEPGHRPEEYGPDSQLPTEIVDTILPWVRSQTPISDRPADITLCGESLGGLTALRTGLAHPEVVGRVIAQSSSLWAADLVPQVPHAAPTLNVQMSVGSFEASMLAQHHELQRALTAAGHHSTLTEFTGGHDMAWWVQLWAASLHTRKHNPEK